MSKDPFDIDNLFKTALENAPMTPPPGAFSAIKSQLPSLATTAAIGTKVVVSVKMLGVVASTLIIAGAAVYFVIEKSSEPTVSSVSNTKMEQAVTPNKEETAKPFIPMISGEAQSNAGESKPRHTGVGDVNPKGLSNIEARRKVTNLSASGIAIGQSNHAATAVASGPSAISNGPLAVSAMNDGMETFSQVPTRSNVNIPTEGVRKASPEKKNGAMVNALNCRSRFEINLNEPVHGAHELAFHVHGEFGRYEWGLGSQIKGTWTAKEGRVNRPIYVKKSQELHFWIRAHFIDGCKDTQSFVRWVSPKNYEVPEVFPSIFTPNNDGYNDSFYVMMSEPEFFEITVMDMRGNRVFTSKNIHEKWSGKVGDRVCPSGIYQVYLTRRYSHETDTEKRNFKLELR